MNVNDALTAVNNWYNSIKNAKKNNDPSTLNDYLNQGSCFSITRSQYNTWRGITGVSYLHAYPCVINGQLQFILIDDVTDSASRLDGNNIFLSPYTYGITTNVYQSSTSGTGDISFLNALERNFRWLMNRQTWVNSTVANKQTIFQAFAIPFSDLTNMFENLPTRINEIYGVLGFLDNGSILGSPDLILWADTIGFNNPASVEDLSCPVPPFGAVGSYTNVNHFQLLVQSNSTNQ